MKAPFFRITKSAAYGLDKESALRRGVKRWRVAEADPMAHDVDPRDFRELEESPFAYWLPDRVRKAIVAQAPLEPTHADVRVGLQTSDDMRFLRLWFEVPPQDLARTREETLGERKWVGFAKGGTFAPFFSDVALVVNFGNDREDMRRFARAAIASGGSSRGNGPLSDFEFFRPGLTYPLRADTLNVRALPGACAFGHKGPSIFAYNEAALPSLLGILNSAMASYCAMLRVPVADAARAGISPAFEVGSVQKLAVPKTLDAGVGECALALLDLHRRAARFRETTHDFVAPLFARATESLLQSWDAEVAYHGDEHATRVAAVKRDLDDRVFSLYGIGSEDRAAIATDLAQSGVGASPRTGDTEEDGDEAEEVEVESENDPVQQSPQGAAEALLSYAVGCAFGRWDVRIGCDPTREPGVGGPFVPLPRCSPGMLVGADGLPVTGAPAGYPIDFPADGVLVEDKDHPRDVARRVRDVFVALYGGAADERLGEALAMAGAPDGDLRVWLRTRFFERVHRPMYTTGGSPPRRAPIYWPIYTRVRRGQPTFGVWLYYPRLSHESLFTVARIIKERRQSEVAVLNRLADAVSDAKGRAARDAKEARAQGDDLVRALRELEDEALRVANLRAVPEFDDGVLLNCCVLHKLVAWGDATSAWGKLQRGSFDWSNVARKLRPAESEAFRATERALAEAVMNKPRKAKKTKKGSRA